MRKLALSLILISFLALTACSKTETKSDELTTPTAPAAEDSILGDSDSGKALGLQTIHFPYDSFLLDSEAKSVLNANAEILKDKTSVKVQIEGHCDQRGGIQYNIALGEKRANAVKKFLQDAGIEAERITTISYGKERLIATQDNDGAYAQNRRANFVITSR